MCVFVLAPASLTTLAQALSSGHLNYAHEADKWGKVFLPLSMFKLSTKLPKISPRLSKIEALRPQNGLSMFSLLWEFSLCRVTQWSGYLLTDITTRTAMSKLTPTVLTMDFSGLIWDGSLIPLTRRSCLTPRISLK